MKVQWDHQLLSSFSLFMDNQIQSKGVAYTNYSGRLYPTPSSFQGLYAYSTPFRSLCNDTSISGAIVMTGVYLNGTFVGVGTSGLSKINHELGTIYFTGALSSNITVSGIYSVKDFNIVISDQPEYKLLFETQYLINPKYNQITSGIPSDVKIAPIIYLKPQILENKPFAFGRIDENSIGIRAIIIADNQFNKIGVCNILKNFNMRVLPYVTSIPLDHLGNYTGLAYNYSGVSTSSTYYPTIWEAKVIEMGRSPETEQMTRNCALVDFRISTIMTHP